MNKNLTDVTYGRTKHTNEWYIFDDYDWGIEGIDITNFHFANTLKELKEIAKEHGFRLKYRDDNYTIW